MAGVLFFRCHSPDTFARRQRLPKDRTNINEIGKHLFDGILSCFLYPTLKKQPDTKPSINLHVDHTSDLRRSHTSFSTFFSSHRLHAVSIHLSTKQTNKTKRNAEVKKKEKQCKTKPYCFVCTSLQPTAAINASCNCINWRSNESDLQICAERPRFLSATAESMFANVSISHLLVVM